MEDPVFGGKKCWEVLEEGAGRRRGRGGEGRGKESGKERNFWVHPTLILFAVTGKEGVLPDLGGFWVFFKL